MQLAFEGEKCLEVFRLQDLQPPSKGLLSREQVQERALRLGYLLELDQRADDATFGPQHLKARLVAGLMDGAD